MSVEGMTALLIGTHCFSKICSCKRSSLYTSSKFLLSIKSRKKSMSQDFTNAEAEMLRLLEQIFAMVSEMHMESVMIPRE